MKRSIRPLPAVLILTALFTILAAVLATAATAGEKDDPFEPFGEITKDAVHHSGFFDLYARREKIYLEIPVDRLGTPVLLIPSLSQGIGTHGLLGGMPLSVFDGMIVKFDRRGDRLHLVQVNHLFRAPEKSPESRAVGFSYGNSILASLEIQSERREGDEIGVVPEPEKEPETSEKTTEDGAAGDEENAAADEAEEEEEPEPEPEPERPVTAVVVDFTSVLVSDLYNVAQAMNEGHFFTRKFGSSYSLDADRSSINSVKVFPKNAEFDVSLTFKTAKDPHLETIIDSRYVTIGVHHSFSELPQEPMSPRYGDPRVGYFLTAFKDFSLDHQDEFFVRYVNRWRLEKKNPNAALSRPVKPIVFYIENTVPEEYRKYIKKGVETWQKAFEAAGFKDAIVARDQPDDPDWAAEDVRYSTIRWITSHRPSFGAIGPSRTDPRTGEILDADILMEANMVQGFHRTWQRLASPIGAERGMDPFAASLDADRRAFEEAAARDGYEAATRLCTAGQGLALSGSLLNMALVQRGDIRAGDSVPIEFVGEALVWVTAHEVGHTLGLMHNFKSSMAVPYEKLHDKSFVRKKGLYGSVMEYPTVNLATDPARQGYYFSPVVGTYDDWAIRYGYSEFKRARTPDEERPYLAEIAAQNAAPEHYFGSDMDSYPMGAVDAFTNTFDLGDDPLAWARERTDYIVSLMDGLEDRMVGEGDSWSNLTHGFQTLLRSYYSGLRFIARQVGGMSTSRSHRGDPGAAPPMVVLSASRQREAVEFLADHLFSDECLPVSPKLMERLEPSRWSHWGVSFMHGDRADFPYHRRILAMQQPVVDRLTHPITLSRIVDAELYQEDSFTLVELFDTMGGAIWSEVVRPDPGATSISAARRGVQRMWLDRLIEVAFTPDPGTPDDARAVARMNLVELGEGIETALQDPESLAGTTRAHLLDCRARVATAVEAGYALEVMNGKAGGR